MSRTKDYLHYNNLFDIYGNLLNEREKEIFHLFYEEDYSMQEIANQRSVSKSAIGTTIKTINKKLDDYEKKLNFFQKEQKYLDMIAFLQNKIKKCQKYEKK